MMKYLAGVVLIVCLCLWSIKPIHQWRAERAAASERRVRQIYENIRLASIEAGKKWQKDGIASRRQSARNCLIYHTGKGDWSDEELDSFWVYRDKVSRETEKRMQNEKRIQTGNIIAGWMKSQED